MHITPIVGPAVKVAAQAFTQSLAAKQAAEEQERRNLERIAETVRETTGAPITARDLVRIGASMHAAPMDHGDRATELLSGGRARREMKQPPAGYTKPPRLSTYRFIPRDGDPTALLERMPLREALEKVASEHRKIADWIRAQRGRPGWDLDRPTREMWQYIHASKRMKLCRNQLLEMWERVISEDAADNLDEHDYAAEAQAEADALSARSVSEKVRSGWPGGGMHA